MKFKSRVFFFLLVCSISFQTATPVFAAGVVTKEKTYTSTQKDEEYTFKTNITVDGRKYKMADTIYEIVSEEPEMETETVSYVKKKTLDKEKSYTPKDSITKDGVIYRLQHTDKSEVTLEEAYTQNVTGYTDYSDKEAAGKAPLTKNVTVVNQKTKKQETVQCDFYGISTLPPEWEYNTVNITFESYNSQYFSWQGLLVEKNISSPLSGYEKEIIESVGGNTQDYQVESITWKGKAYKNSKGILCRDAAAQIKRKINHYRVTYKGEIREDSKKAITYTSTYSGTKSTQTGNTVYTIKAAATYEKVTNMLAVVAGLTVGVLLFIILVIGIIYLLKKKQTGKNAFK